MKRFPNATPNKSGGTTPLTSNAQSQALRHRGSAIFPRKVNPTGLKIKPTKTRNIARYNDENEAAYNSGHAANTAPPPRMNQTWFPSHTGSTDSSKARRSSSVRPTNVKIAHRPTWKGKSVD